MDEIVALRHELAQLLGFATYADYSLATKMAERPQQVLGFLNDLAERSRPQAQRELAELRQFAAEQFGVTELAAWDLSFYAEKLKQHRYAISDEVLRPYFPAPRVISGLFETVRRLFGLRIQPRLAVETWHPDVNFYDIYDRDGELRGSFYLDLYARPHKRGGAWMDDCLGRRFRQDGTLQRPVAYLTCNFNGPVGDQPALFTHDEVVTLFHEFGHGIHHMLTQIDVAGVAGIHGVPWDAVELPSQFMENWCWEPEALAFLSGHYQTGEPLPQAELDQLLAAKNFQSAMQMLRQLEFSLFDFRLHHEFDPAQGAQVQAVLDDVRTLSVFPAPAFQPLPAQLLAHLCRWLRGRLLQLQVGGSAVGGCLLALRGGGDLQRQDWRGLPASGAGDGGLPLTHGVVPRLPWPGADHRCPAAPQRHYRLTLIRSVTPNPAICAGFFIGCVVGSRPAGAGSIHRRPEWRDARVAPARPVRARR